MFLIQEPDRFVTKIKKLTLHPNFDTKTYDMDFAIVEIEDPVDFHYKIKPICLDLSPTGNIIYIKY